MSYVYKILANPFYAGVLIWNGRTYQGAHEPVVSMEEFDRVQGLLGRPGNPRPSRRSFAFTGMIRCGACGGMITAEEKTNRHGSHYAYYHCTKRRIDFRCRQPSVSRDSLQKQIGAFLSSLVLPERLLAWAHDVAAADSEQDSESIDERKRTLQSRLQRIAKSIENLTSLRIRDLISDAEFIRERHSLDVEGLRIRQQLAGCDDSAPWFEPLQTLISFCNKAVDWFLAGDDTIKRMIFGIVGSNPVLQDKMLRVQAKKPFQLLSKDAKVLKLCGYGESNPDLHLGKVAFYH